MDIVVINPKGRILVKVDGVIYQIDGKTFHIIKNDIFDIDKPVLKPICGHCQNYPNCERKNNLGSPNITDGFTLVDEKDAKVNTLRCALFKKEETFFGPIFISTLNNPKTPEEREQCHYCDPDNTLQAGHVAHPGIARALRRNNI